MSQPPYGNPPEERYGQPPGGNPPGPGQPQNPESGSQPPYGPAQQSPPSGPQAPYGGPPMGPPSGPQDPYAGQPIGPPSGPQSPYGAPPPGPPSGPQAPYGAQPTGPGQPYGAPPGGPQGPYGGPPGGYPPGPGPYGESPYSPGQQRGNRGVIIAVVAVGAVVLLAAVGGVAFFLMRGGGAVHEAAPQCADLESSLLEELVPDAELQRDDFTEQDFWDELVCEWRSSGTTSGVPGFATVSLMRNDGGDPIGITENDLETDISGQDASPVEGIGDEAFSWYDDDNQVGCVGARTDNIYVRTCYDAAQDFLDPESIEPDLAVSQATDLASDIVATIAARA